MCLFCFVSWFVAILSVLRISSCMQVVYILSSLQFVLLFAYFIVALACFNWLLRSSAQTHTKVKCQVLEVQLRRNQLFYHCTKKEKIPSRWLSDTLDCFFSSKCSMATADDYNFIEQRAQENGKSYLGLIEAACNLFQIEIVNAHKWAFNTMI